MQINLTLITQFKKLNKRANIYLFVLCVCVSLYTYKSKSICLRGFVGNVTIEFVVVGIFSCDSNDKPIRIIL